MLGAERRREILDLLGSDGRVLVAELSRHFQTSEITIRKDLSFLHQAGRVERIYGGALPKKPGAAAENGIETTTRRQRNQENRIAAAAAQKIRPGQVIVLESGAMTMAIARACRNIKNLTIITNAINITTEHADSTVEVILTGGTLRKDSFALEGLLAEESLRKLSADMVFLEVDALDVRHGVTAPNLVRARLSRAMVSCAKRTVAICVAKNLGKKYQTQVITMRRFHEVITDGELSRKDLKILQDKQIEVTLVRKPWKNSTKTNGNGNARPGAAVRTS